MVDQYAVFGNPIKQSQSPRIHQLFAESTEQDMFYGRSCVELGGFAAAAKAFFGEGGVGLNITAPFKLDAYEFANNLSDRARRAGAVNTLMSQTDGSIRGDNTDGAGLVADICHRNGWVLRGASVLILGAGGAVRGVLASILAEQPRQIIIANRTERKVERLATAFKGVGNVQACGFDSIPKQSFDIVINATSAGLGGSLPPVPETVFKNPEVRCYDMIYGAQDTAFIAWAKGLGCQYTSDGLGMLVGQAAESFFIWRGVRPDQAPVIETLRRSLQ